MAGESISSRLRRKRETFYDDKECELSETKRRRECHHDVRISICHLATRYPSSPAPADEDGCSSVSRQEAGASLDVSIVY